MNYKIAVIPGDGIGPEVIDEAVKVLDKVAFKFGHKFEYEKTLMGGIAIDNTGMPLPSQTISICKQSDAILLGAIGGWQWDALESHLRPEAGLLALRKELSLFANLRPIVSIKETINESPLKYEILAKGIDILIVRELIGGIYFGKKGIITKDNNTLAAFDVEEYSENEIIRIAHVAFKMASKRKKQVISVDKANVLESSKLWRKVFIEISKEYPEIALQHMYVDNAAMQLVRNPSQFDVIVTNNIFGDILSDEASIIAGSIGMLPSASLAQNGLGMYEPIHGSAPDIAGQNIANPIATILSAAMMLRYSFGLEEEAQTIEKAISKTLAQGYRTSDLKSLECITLGTSQMGEKIKENI